MPLILTDSPSVKIPSSWATPGRPRLELETEAKVAGIDDATFQKHAKDAKENCPVSKALTGVAIELKAKLLA